MSIEMLKFDCREEGRAEGRVEGEAKGRNEEKRENALNFLKKGIDALLVAECTNLTLDEVQALAATL